MPDAQGNIRGISLAGVSNAWLDSLRREGVYVEPDPGCSYPDGERCGVRCWDTERCAYILEDVNARRGVRQA